jgi:hypothetical protein
MMSLILMGQMGNNMISNTAKITKIRKSESRLASFGTSQVMNILSWKLPSRLGISFLGHFFFTSSTASGFLSRGPTTWCTAMLDVRKVLHLSQVKALFHSFHFWHLREGLNHHSSNFICIF